MERVLEALEMILETKEEELKNVNGYIESLRKNRDAMKIRVNALDLSIVGQEKIINELAEKGNSDADAIMVLHRETKHFVAGELNKTKDTDLVIEHKISDLVMVASDLVLDIKEITAFVKKERRSS